ncbi:hypothetical protein JCM18920_1736 [Cutibacterium acnes JCM 18920]|nr:hypothetical protein JCM18920_1736 [Cutibacterium acnes JCM 18920]
MLVVHGTMQVNGHPDVSPAISGIAGLGHIGLSVGLVGSWWPCSHHFRLRAASPKKTADLSGAIELLLWPTHPDTRRV